MGASTSCTTCFSGVSCFNRLAWKMSVRKRNRDAMSFLFDKKISERHRNSASSTGLASNECDICFLAHGMGGTEHDWDVWVETLASDYPDWSLHALKSLEEGTRFCGDTVCQLSQTAAREMISILEDKLLAPKIVLTLHCIGHSMGGLIIRGALPSVIEHFSSKGQCARLSFGHYMSLSSPHLGVRASWASLDAWKNFAWLSSYVSDQVPQLTLHDDADGGGPFLARLSVKDGPYIKCLEAFHSRTCATLASGDPLIPLPSGVINPKCIVTASSAGFFQTADWWFGETSGMVPKGAFANWCEELDRMRRENMLVTPRLTCGRPTVYSEASINVPLEIAVANGKDALGLQSSMAPSRCRNCESLADVKLVDATSSSSLEWEHSADWTCCYPREVFDCLDTLHWQRVVVEMTHPPLAKNAHVFLIGKKSEQWELEHAMSKECIQSLSKIFLD